MANPFTILCLASYRKGDAFLCQAKREGARVLLLTSKSLEGSDWPRECLDDIYYMPDVEKAWKMDEVIRGVSYLARTQKIDRIVALDDFDVEKAAALREHLRTPGMGDTTARYFRDKLAMRTRAREVGLNVPAFIHVLNHDDLRAFLRDVAPPWVLKPRLLAGAIGIKKLGTAEEFWRTVEALGDDQSNFLLEQFVPGDVYHVDSIVCDYKIQLAVASRYGTPPLQVSHEGRVFSTRTVTPGGKEDRQLQRINAKLLKAFGYKRGISHSEFIRAKSDSKLFFLETSARVGGAHIVDLVEAATGLNLWAEWARLETRGEDQPYTVDAKRQQHAALLVSLARQEQPDLSQYNDPEVVWRLTKKNHAGVIVASADEARVDSLLASYTERFYQDFFASAPPRDRPMD